MSNAEGNPIDSEANLIVFEAHMIDREECPINREMLMSDAERNYCVFEVNPTAREAETHGKEIMLAVFIFNLTGLILLSNKPA